MGAKRKYKIKINGIRKEDLKKNLWTHKSKGWYVEDQNERRAKQTDRKPKYYKLHQGAKISWVRTRTSNAR